MYEFNEERSLSGLLEQLKGAAVAVSEGLVTEYNSAAKRILPELREGEPLKMLGAGTAELCGAQFEANAYDAGDCQIYTFAMPAQTPLENALPLMENLSRVILDSLNASFVASELIAGATEREKLGSLGQHNAILRHEQYRLLHLANNLKELAALAGGEDVLRMELFELDLLCEQIMGTVRTVLAGRGIELAFLAEAAGCMVRADKKRVERVLLALLSNSAEACAGGGNITLRLTREQGRFCLLLEDDGAGIREERYADIMDSFAKAAELENAAQGTGLSLLVARETILRHGGSFAIRSRQGEGTRVIFSLPVNRAETVVLNSGRVEYAANPMRPVLMEFANMLDHTFYAPPYL